MKIEEIRKNKRLRPYFLWYLKYNMMLTDTPVSMIVVRAGKGSDSLDIIANYERSMMALIGELKKEGVHPDRIGLVINSVCHDLVEELGKGKIVNGTPELLIQMGYNSN